MCRRAAGRPEADGLAEGQLYVCRRAAGRLEAGGFAEGQRNLYAEGQRMLGNSVWATGEIPLSLLKGSGPWAWSLGAWQPERAAESGVGLSVRGSRRDQRKASSKGPKAVDGLLTRSLTSVLFGQ